MGSALREWFRFPAGFQGSESARWVGLGNAILGIHNYSDYGRGEMADIVFISRYQVFTGVDIRQQGAGGIVSGTILLAEALVRQGHRVRVFNDLDAAVSYEGVDYCPWEKSVSIEADLVVSNNTAEPFGRVSAGKKVVWQRNKTSLIRAWKRRELGELFRSRPHLVVLSNNALRNTPFFFPYQSRTVIPHAVEDPFLEQSSESSIPAPKAFFASRPSRNLSWVIEVWKELIQPRCPEAELHICSSYDSSWSDQYEDLDKYNILCRGCLPKLELAELMRTSRVLLYPGHESETGCQVALQSIGSGTPIVTCGIGCLKDLVEHGKTGYIEKTKDGFAEKAVRLLSDDDEWMARHEAVSGHDFRRSYDERAEDWVHAFLG